MRWQQYQNETATRQRRDSVTVRNTIATKNWHKNNETEKISTEVSDEEAATHWQDSDTDSNKKAKDAAETDESATMIYW